MDTASIPSLGNVVAHKYRIDREIGRGGMGIVYAATDLTLGRVVALKLLLSADPHGATGRSNAATTHEDTARFMREARATAALRAEHVAQVYEAGITPEGVPFLAMELLHGEDLEQYAARRGPLPYAEACDLLIQACVALAEAHQLGIVHRDLKPQNFFVLPPRDATGPRLKVLDFGISKMSSEADLALTQTSMTMGSPRYMSPEQVRSSKYVDARADIWALGAVLFECMAGRPLFNESTASALYAQIIADAALPLRHVRLDAPAELEHVVLRCVDKDPARRFASTVELAHALAPFASAQGRAVAARLLEAHGLKAPGSYTSQAVPYPATTPGYTQTGQPLAPRAPHPSARTKSYLWIWIVLGVFALLCVIAAALSGLLVGAAVQTVSELPTEPPLAATNDDGNGEPPTESDGTPRPAAVAAAADAGPRRARVPDKAKNEARELAAERELAAQRERGRASGDDFKANNIRAETVARGAAESCRKNELVALNTQFAPDGPAVAAALAACREAKDNSAVTRITRAQERRRSAERSGGP